MLRILHILLLIIAVFVSTSVLASPEVNNPKFTTDIQQDILQSFSNTASFNSFNNTSKIWSIIDMGKIVGYVFESNLQVSIPAYSGQPVNLVIAIDKKGEFKYAKVIEHHEPILLVGIPEKKLDDFVMQYVGHSITDTIKVGTNIDEKEIGVDAVTGATVTVLVVNETIMRATRKAAISLGLMQPTPNDNLPASKVKYNFFQQTDWETLVNSGDIRRLYLTQGDVDAAFAKDVTNDGEQTKPLQKQETFIDLYYAYLNPPSIGKNLLGESEYNWLMSQLKPGEHAVAFMANGKYSFKGNGFVRGGIFDRINIIQKGADITFRDLDYTRLSDIYPKGHPNFTEMALYIIRNHYQFNPGLDWKLNLLVKQQTGPIKSIFVNFTGDYQTSESYIQRPSIDEINAAKPPPLWLTIWQGKKIQLSILIASLVLLLVIIFLENWIVKHPKLLFGFRTLYLCYTVGFIGWYALGQLSIVNIFTFTQALSKDFRWELFLMDPVIFIIWIFTAVTVLLWGRGVFCGWLCPFGALQELLNEAARKLKIKQFTLPFFIHEKLWALKYLILLALFGISLESIYSAERLAEVEPFKTSILLVFQREWWFVTYAVSLLFTSLFIRKIYCRYICPLGAALAIPTKLRLFNWLKRRPECGRPCQLCAKECEIQAIHPDGTINENECHHCLDCQITYFNKNRCPPLVMAEKRGKRRVGGRLTEEQRLEIIEISKTV